MADRAQTEPAGNRRTYPRFELEVEVTQTSEHNFFTGFTENISEGGVFIATQHPLPLGTRFHFRLTLPDEPTPIQAVGEVRWLRTYHSDREAISPGIGVRFIELNPADQARVQRFLQQREAIFYDD